MSSVTTTSAVVLHLVEGEDKNAAKNAVLSSLITGEGLSTSIMRSKLSNGSGQMTNAFRYAKNSYTLALPSGRTTQLQDVPYSVFNTAIKEETGYAFDVIALRHKYITYNPYMEVYDFLVSDRKFDINTEGIYSYPGLSFNNGECIKIISSNVSADGLSIDMVYEYWAYVVTTITEEVLVYDKVEYVKVSTFSETINRPSTTNNIYLDRSLIIWYNKLDTLGAILPGEYYWIYRIETGLRPELDNTVTVGTVDEYFPVVPIRSNNVDLTRPDTDTDLYRTSKILLNILKLPIKALGDKVNASPDIAQIDNAYVMFGADVQSKCMATLAYLNHYFDYLGTQGSNIYTVSGYNNELPDRTVPFAFSRDTVPEGVSSLTEHGLGLRITFSEITTTYIPGKIDRGKLGNARRTLSSRSIPGYYTSEGDVATYIESYSETTLTLDLQITPSTLRRVEVKNLVAFNIIGGGPPVITTIDNLINNPEDHNMVIPLEYNMSRRLPVSQRNALYADCTLLVITSIERRKLKWYEEGWFQGIIMIVGFAISVLSFQYWVTGLIAAGFTSLTAILIALIVMTAISIITKIAANWLIDKYGAKLGIIGAVILAIVAMVLSRGQAGWEIIKDCTLSYAQIVLQAAQAVISATNEFIAKGTQSVIDEYNQFMELLKDAYDAINTNTEVQLLGNKNTLNPLIYTHSSRYYSPYETVEGFFQRTIELPSNTLYGIHNAIPDFVSNLLVPKKDAIFSTSGQ